MDVGKKTMKNLNVKDMNPLVGCLMVLLVIAAVLAVSWLMFWGFTWSVLTLFGHSIALTWWNWLAWNVGLLCTFGLTIGSKSSQK